MNPIGYITTCFSDKFGTPRQSLLLSEAKGILKLNPEPGFREACNHLESFSHLWIVFQFHEHTGWRPTTRPPRLQGPRRVGVFASRAPHRPNPIGLSAVKLDRVDLDAPNGIELHLSGVDFLNGTPVLDIKPYLPYADRIEGATQGWAEGEIQKYPVRFSSATLPLISEIESEKRFSNFSKLIVQILELDPRPTSTRKAWPIGAQKTEGREFKTRMLDFDLEWRVVESALVIENIKTHTLDSHP